MKKIIEKPAFENIQERNLIDIQPYNAENFTQSGYKLHINTILRHFTDGKLETIHDFNTDPSSFIFIPNDYVIAELKEKVIISSTLITGKIYPDFNLTVSGIAFFCPLLTNIPALSSAFFDKEPAPGSIYIGIKNLMERNITLDPGQLVGYLQLFNLTDQEEKLTTGKQTTFRGSFKPKK